MNGCSWCQEAYQSPIYEWGIRTKKERSKGALLAAAFLGSALRTQTIKGSKALGFLRPGSSWMRLEYLLVVPGTTGHFLFNLVCMEVPGSTKKPMEVHPSYWKYPELPRSIWKYPEVPGSTRKYPEVPGSTRKYLEVP